MQIQLQLYIRAKCHNGVSIILWKGHLPESKYLLDSCKRLNTICKNRFRMIIKNEATERRCEKRIHYFTY